MQIFDSMTSGVDRNEDDEKGRAEEDWMTNHPQSSLSYQPVASKTNLSSDF